MKAFVVTNKEGKVIGHIRIEQSKSKDDPTPGRIIPDPGQKVHEVDFPNEFLEIKDVGKLHEALEKHLKELKLL